MKLTIQRTVLIDGINAAARAASSHAAYPILEGLLLESTGQTLTVVGNNMEMGITFSAPAEISTGGRVVVNARLFGDIVRKCGGEEVRIECDSNHKLTIRCGGSRFSLSGINPDDYVMPTPHSGGENITLPQRVLRDLIRYTIFSVGTGEAKVTLTGCLLEADAKAARMVSIDGFRLSLRTHRFHPDEEFVDITDPHVSVIIPSRTLNELSRLLGDTDDAVHISYGGKSVQFMFGNITLVSRLIEGEFIDYRKIIPAAFKATVTLPVKQLTEVIERVQLVAVHGGNKSSVVIKMTQTDMTLTCETPTGVAEETLQAEIDGDTFDIGFNPRYLLEALRAVTDNKVQMNFAGHINPCLLLPPSDTESVADSYKYLILPVRL